MKYKPCCNRRCLLGHCETREAGGCHCVCYLKDAEHTIESLIDGRTYKVGDGIIFDPRRPRKPLEGERKDEALKQLEEIKSRLKEYEILRPSEE